MKQKRADKKKKLSVKEMRKSIKKVSLENNKKYSKIPKDLFPNTKINKKFKISYIQLHKSVDN